MLCSIELDAESMATVAATLANGGVCPLTDERVFAAETCRHTLSLMASCGMYDYSGEFAFLMGFPCKSGVGGSLMIVIPGVAGLCTWSPRLDKHGNSSRGIDFCRRLAARFPYHMLDSTQYLGAAAGSTAPRAHQHQQAAGVSGDDEAETADAGAVEFWNAAAAGDLLRVKQLAGRGICAAVPDYDGRTAAHLAASNGHLEVLEYVLDGTVGGRLEAEDRFGNTPLNDAEREGHGSCAALIRRLQKEQQESEEEDGENDSAGDLGRASVRQGSPELSEQGHGSSEAQQALDYRQISMALRALATQAGGLHEKAELMAALAEAGVDAQEGGHHLLAAELSKLPGRFSAADLAMNSGCSRQLQQLVVRALTGQLTVPCWSGFAATIEELFTAATAEVATPDAAAATAEVATTDAAADSSAAVAVVSVSGQRCAFGRSDEAVVLDELAAAINYCVAQDEHGVAKVHEHVGREPSGRGAAAVALDDTGRPHNPLGAAGALLMCTLVEKSDDGGERPLHQRFSALQQKYSAAAGGAACGFDNVNFAKERSDSDQSYCLAYLMRQSGCIERAASINTMLELFFMTNAVTLSVDALAVVAATLANSGVCPLTGHRVFSTESSRNCLSLMSSCGSGELSGEFAFKIGLPAKVSAATGVTLVVVPGIAGFCVRDGQHPRASESGDGRAQLCPLSFAFCERLVCQYQFHAFDRGGGGGAAGTRANPLQHPAAEREHWISSLLAAAAAGDVSEFRRLQLLNPSTDAVVQAVDYDGRTALHLAAAEGQHRIVRLLLAAGADMHARDRWGRTAVDEAERSDQATVSAELVAWASAQKAHVTLGTCSIAERDIASEEGGEGLPPGSPRVGG